MYQSFHNEVTRPERKFPIWAVVAGALAGAFVVALNQSSTFHHARVAVPTTSTATQSQVTGYYRRLEFNTLHTIQAANQASSSSFSSEVPHVLGNSSLMSISGGLLLIGSALFNLWCKQVHGTLPSLTPLGTVVVPASQQVVADAHTSNALMAVTAEKKTVGTKSPVFNETALKAAFKMAKRSIANLPVKDAATGSIVGNAELSLKTAGFNSRYVVYRKFVAERANRREGNAHTKTRGEVRGGGRKPYAQKGTGQARQGSIRSPLIRGGGVAFGPRNTKNYHQKVNRKEGRLAISTLIQNRAPLITVIKDMETIMNTISTKKAVALIESWRDQAKGRKVLLVMTAPEGTLRKHPLVLSTNNLPTVRLLIQQQLCVKQLLWPNQILMSEKALESLKLRFALSDDLGDLDCTIDEEVEGDQDVAVDITHLEGSQDELLDGARQEACLD